VLAWWERQKEVAARALEYDKDDPFEHTPPIFYV
jgi:hypothetical protein